MAQRTLAELQTQINTLLADNTTGAISEADVRSILTDIRDSFFSLTDHGVNQIQGLSTTLTALQNSITGLQFTLADKSDEGHGHEIAEINNLATTLSTLSTQITNLQNSLAGKADSNHTQAISTVTGLQAALDGKATTTHTHPISQVTDLEAVLDQKSPLGHTHTSNDITDAATLFLDATADAALITALASATWTGEIGAVTASPAWAQGRMHYAAGLLYVAVASNSVARYRLDSRNITISTSAASGGSDGDVWLQVPA